MAHAQKIGMPPGPWASRSSELRAASRSALSAQLRAQLAARRAVGHWGHGPGRACALCPCALGPRCPVPCPAHCACACACAAQSLLTAIHSMASCSCSAQCCVLQCCVLLPAAAAAQRPAAARTQSPRCRRCRCTCATTHNALIYCQRGRGRGSSCRQAGGRRGGRPVTSSCCRSLCSAELSAFSSGSGGEGSVVLLGGHNLGGHRLLSISLHCIDLSSHIGLMKPVQKTR
jgi:hypothetical protein